MKIIPDFEAENPVIPEKLIPVYSKQFPGFICKN